MSFHFQSKEKYGFKQKKITRKAQTTLNYSPQKQYFRAYRHATCAHFHENTSRIKNHLAESGKSFSAEKTKNNKNNNFERPQTPEKIHENALETPI